MAANARLYILKGSSRASIDIGKYDKYELEHTRCIEILKKIAFLAVCWVFLEQFY